MKLMIDIPKYNLDEVQNGSIACSQILKAVKNGIPVSTEGDSISRSALINAFNEAQVEFDEYYKGLGKAKVITDNAPTIPLPDFKEGYKQAIRDGKTNYSRPQGKWINGICSNCGAECFEDDYMRDIKLNFVTSVAQI